MERTPMEHANPAVVGGKVVGNPRAGLLDKVVARRSASNQTRAVVVVVPRFNNRRQRQTFGGNPAGDASGLVADRPCIENANLDRYGRRASNSPTYRTANIAMTTVEHQHTIIHGWRLSKCKHDRDFPDVSFDYSRALSTSTRPVTSTTASPPPHQLELRDTRMSSITTR